jgi:GAF domain-containing protein
MLTAPRPPDEAARLRALKNLMLLDTPPEERFDRVVQFAAEQLDMPVALVSLIDGERQWFKSRFGLDATEGPRDLSFCGHAILRPELFVIEDTLLDERFADNPFVTHAPYVRFYAGAPLSAASGHRVGTLCVIDTKARSLDAVELAVLESLRDLVNEALLEEGTAS